MAPSLPQCVSSGSPAKAPVAAKQQYIEGVIVKRASNGMFLIARDKQGVTAYVPAAEVGAAMVGAHPDFLYRRFILLFKNCKLKN